MAEKEKGKQIENFEGRDLRWKKRKNCEVKRKNRSKLLQEKNK